MGYNSVIVIYSDVQIVPYLACWNLFKLASLLFLVMSPSFFEHFLSCTKRYSGLILHFLCSCFEITVSSMSSVSLSRRMVFRNQVLGSMCTHCCWGVAAPGPFLWIELGKFDYTLLNLFIMPDVSLKLFSKFCILCFSVLLFYFCPVSKFTCFLANFMQFSVKPIW